MINGWTEPNRVKDWEKEREPLTALRHKSFQCNKTKFKSATTKYILHTFTEYKLTDPRESGATRDNFLKLSGLLGFFLTFSHFPTSLILLDQTENTSRK